MEDTLTNPPERDRKRKQFQKENPFWNLPWAINYDLPQSSKLMAFFPVENPRLKTCQANLLSVF